MSETVSTPRPAGRRRRGKKSGRGMRILLICAASLVALIAVAWLGFNTWLRGYLRGESFRTFLSGRISSKLDATGSIDMITWRDSQAQIDEYRAEGNPGAAFATMQVQDIRAGIDTGAIWDRVWKIDEVKIARVRIEAGGQKSPADSAAPAAVPAAAVAEPEAPRAPSWLAQFVPNRTQIGVIKIGAADVRWQNETQSAQLTGLPLELEPTDSQKVLLVRGRGGEIAWSGMPDLRFNIDDLQITRTDEEILLDRFVAMSTGTGNTPVRINAEAKLAPSATGPGSELEAEGVVSGLNVKQIVPENWLQRLSGLVTLDGKMKMNTRRPESLAARGKFALKNGSLQALPVLDIIARKTRNASFATLTLREASADAVWSRAAGTELDRILVDCPGLLRLRGRMRIAADGQLQGALLVGIVPNTLSYVAGAEDYVFVPLEKLNLTTDESRLTSAEDQPLRWARMTLSGTMDAPVEDLSDRLAQAWFNATVEQVLNMPMEEAIRRAEEVSRVAAGAAGKVLEQGTKAGSELIDGKPAEALKTGIDAGKGIIEGGASVIEGLIGPK